MDPIRNWIDERADDLADLLARLVACETENPPGRGLAECAEVLRDAMERLGLRPEVLEPPVVRGTAGDADSDKIVYFHGHFDVVPAQDPAQFRARRENGRIVGRGTADMKGGIVSMLYGAAAAQDLGLLGDGRVVLHLVGDEETGSTAGSGYLRDRGLIDPNARAMLTAEQSGEAIWPEAKGALSLRVDVHGKPAHVGQAPEGVNSFLHMLPIARALGEYADGRTIVVGGQSGGGSNFNVVPDHTRCTIDGRFAPDEDLDAELATLTRIVTEAAKAAGAHVDLEVTQQAPPAHTPPGHPAAMLLADTVEEVVGHRPNVERCPGCLDTRWYAQLGIPSFGYGPGTMDVSHGPHEYVEEAALHRVATSYALFASRLLG
jgi:succinyl-diaminopimelate desuccinylase